MMRRVFVRAAAFAALSLASACSNDTGLHCTAVPFTASLPVPPRMINPAPGSTGLPTSGFSVQIEFGNDAEHEVLRLGEPNGASLFGSAFTPIVPPPPGPQPLPDHQASVPQLAPHTTYAVFVDGVGFMSTGSSCGPQPQSTSAFSTFIGTFTTM